MSFHKLLLIFFYFIKNFIKYSYCLQTLTAFSLEIGILDTTSALKPKKIARLNTILNNSALTADQNPEVIADKLNISEYDPILLSVLATVRSELPKRKGKWKTIQLLPSKEAKACAQSIPMMFKQSQTNSPYTFVILPSPYSNWREGSISNQLSYILDKNFNEPNIITFNGYLSPAFLRNSCQFIPWDILSLSKDLHLRIRKYLNEEQHSSEHTGLIGVSGGGSLTIAMLAQASDFSRTHNTQNTFGLGGMSFSPILHGRAILHNLDIRHAQSTINPTWGLSTRDLRNLSHFLYIFILPKQDQVMHLYDKNPTEFRQRVFNEFTVSYLRDTLKALRYHPSDINGEINYYNVYINTSFLNDTSINKLADRTQTTWNADNVTAFSSINHNFSAIISDHSSINTSFDQAISLQNMLPLIDKPLFIYSAQDDPIIFFPDESNPLFHSSLEVLETAKNHPHIIAFNPKYGSHAGILLDPIFEELVTTFFQP